MTGVRHARGFAAALLAAPLLFAATPAGAHGGPNHGFTIELGSARASSLTVTEGQSATVPVNIRCSVQCGYHAYGQNFRNQRAYFDIEVTTPSGAGGATLSSNVRLRHNRPICMPTSSYLSTPSPVCFWHLTQRTSQCSAWRIAVHGILNAPLALSNLSLDKTGVRL